MIESFQSQLNKDINNMKANNNNLTNIKKIQIK